MKKNLEELCSRFIENRDLIKSAFGWESAYLYPVCAAIFTDKRQTADIRRMKECNEILKEHTGIFSDFRSTAKLSMVAMMAADDYPDEKLRRALNVYGNLKEHFWSSQYLPVASMIIADLVNEDQYGEVAERTRHIYNLMKNEHPFLTSGEDSVFAAMLALSGLPDEQIVSETEKCYRILKQEFFSGNAIQTLSHVLALSEGNAEEKCRRTYELYQGLKSKGYSYGTGYELATLGVLAMLPENQEVIMEDIMAVDDYLAGQKGYGMFGVGRKQRLMHAAMLVSSAYKTEDDNRTMSTAAIGGTISMIVAQEAAMCAVIAASSAAAVNSANN